MERRGKRITIAEVAHATGVSVATVSLVLNGYARTAQISAATSLAVERVAAELGYVPNHAARSLRRRRTNVLTLVVFTLTNPYYADIASAARVAAAKRGYRVNIVEADRPDAERDVLRDLRSGDSDGVIVATTRHHADPMAAKMFHGLTERGVPAVTVIDYSIDPAIPVIRIDDAAGAYLGTAHLLGLGHRRVAYLTHATADALEHQEQSHASDRYWGYRRALVEAGVRFDPAWVSAAGTTLDGGRAAMCALLAQAGPRPTAAFCFNDLMAIGALRALHEAGVRVPDEMAVVGFDGIELAAFTTPALTTVAHSREDLGHVAVETLIALLEGDSPVEAECVLPCQLIVRESCGGLVALREEPAVAADE